MGATVSQSCKIIKCNAEHRRHYCRLCKDNDSDHFSSECPRGKTLYHGTHIGAIKPIAMGGLKESGNGRLGRGVYFVETLEQAKNISKYRDKNCTVVFKCQVNLRNNIDLGRGDGGDWQLHKDSASSIHPPWANINHDFKEYCVKSSNDCVVTSIFIDDTVIRKNENMTWGDAENIIKKLNPNSTFEDVKPLLGNLKKEKRKFIRQLGRRRNLSMSEISVEWFLSRWYLIVKTLFTLFFIINSIWSAVHLNKQDNRNMAAIVFFIIFLFLQSIANIVLLVVHGIASLDTPHKINLIITLTKFVIAFCLEMPMLVSQVFAIKENIKQQNLTWSDFSWDVAVQFQFVFNLMLFGSIDLVYNGLNRYQFNNYTKLAVWVPGVTLLSKLMAGLVFTPIHLTQLGFNWRPKLSDFEGKIGNSVNIRNLLSFSMYMGAIGLWSWPVVFPICCLLALKIMFGFSLRSLYKRWYLLLKAFLILFNIWNGIWSLDHLYSKSNDNIDYALASFICFFTLQSLENLIYISIHALYASKDPRMAEKWHIFAITKLLIAFVFEMPMLTSQAYAMRNLDNLVWSELNWDVGMQLQFIINITLFLVIDCFYMALEHDYSTCTSVALVIFIPIPSTILCGVLSTPVYLARVGWNWLPNSLKCFGGCRWV